MIGRGELPINLYTFIYFMFDIFDEFFISRPYVGIWELLVGRVTLMKKRCLFNFKELWCVVVWVWPDIDVEKIYGGGVNDGIYVEQWMWFGRVWLV